MERGRGGTSVAGAVVTMLAGKARSLAARRRARRAGPDRTELAGPDGETAEPRAEAALDRNGLTEDAADRGGSERAEDSDSAVADLDGPVLPDDEALQARLAALLEPPGEPPTRLRGREQLLARLDALVWAPDARTHLLAGPGGSGKTAVALWLARGAGRRGVPAWWVPATDTPTVTARLVELAAYVGARPGEVAAAKAGQRAAADLLWGCLERRAPWLLVIDGADDPDVLTGWLRRTQNGLVVVTTRVSDRAAWGRHTEVHTLGPLDPAAGGQVLADLAPRAGRAPEAAALSQRLGGLPLALQHAGSQLAAGLPTPAAGPQTFAGYTPGVDGSHGDTELAARAIVAATRDRGLEALAAAGVAQARALLRVLGCLAPGIVIPASMLDLRVLARVCDGDTGRAARGLRALAAAGLITAVSDADVTAGVIVHSAVTEASRGYTGDAARAGGVAVGMLAAAAAAPGARAAAERPGERPGAERLGWMTLQPHVSAVFSYLGGVLGEADLAELTRLAGAAASAFGNEGCTVIAAELATAALRHARRLGAEHPCVLALRAAVARAESGGDGTDGAEAELRDLLAAQLRVLGPEHPDTLGTAHQFARLLARQGEYEQAERRLRELLAARARTLGPDHPGTLTTWHDLGLVLAQRGQYTQAAREFSGLLAARARLLGPDHRDTRVTRRWLAHMADAEATLRSG